MKTLSAALAALSCAPGLFAPGPFASAGEAQRVVEMLDNPSFAEEPVAGLVPAWSAYRTEPARHLSSGL